VLAADHPQSVRHCFYRMTDPRLPEPVEKSDRGTTKCRTGSPASVGAAGCPTAGSATPRGGAISSAPMTTRRIF
jgi:hypothetical protein